MLSRVVCANFKQQRSMAAETQRRKPVAVFMAFGTQGDVYPIAAIAAAFAFNQRQYDVVLVTHAAHENLTSHLKERSVAFLSIKSPPVLSLPEAHDSPGMQDNFLHEKNIIVKEHRQECYSAIEASFGHEPSIEGDFILINFFALEGWSLAELFHVRCVVAAPYVVPYSAPSAFESHFKRELPLLYKCLQDSSTSQVCWKDVIHWMWPLFTEYWGSWRSDDLNLSPYPFTDPVTGHPMLHDLPPSPLLLYGFSKEIVECPDYWPSNISVCGFWFLPIEWQFSCKKCAKLCALTSNTLVKDEMCSAHLKLLNFLKNPASEPPVFVGLSSVGSMGFLRNPHAFLQIIQTVLEITNYRFILFTAGYEPLDEAIQCIAAGTTCFNKRQYCEEGICLFNGRLFCFPGMIPYKWLFPRCLAAIHHGGSGSTAAALHAGIPQVICPFMLDQFYWAEKMHWIGVSPEPLKRNHLAPDKLDALAIRIAANVISRALNDALSPKVKAQAIDIAKIISLEDGVMEAVKMLEQEMNCPN